MADAQRMTVDSWVLHHAVTPLWDEKSKAEIAQWFSDNGFTRGYGSNPANWSGLINPYTGQRSYAQAQTVGQRVTDRTPDATAAERAAGYRVFPIVADIWGQICWHAGNWTMNRRSIGTENLGDYRNYPLRDGDIKVLADFWRGRDRELNGNTYIYGHQQVSDTGTECPARIMESVQAIINKINENPAPAPTPTPTPNVTRYVRLAKLTYRFIRDANLWDFDYDAQSKFTVKKSFKAGDTIDIVGKAVYKTGSEYFMTEYSFGQADATGKPTATTGINKVDLELVVFTPLPVVTTKDETLTIKVPFEKSSYDDQTLAKGQIRIDKQGVDGQRTVVYAVTYTDGKETGRTIKSDTVTVQTITEVTAIGTYEEKANELDPADGENVANWLTRVFRWLLELLSKFNYKK